MIARHRSVHLIAIGLELGAGVRGLKRERVSGTVQ